MAGQPVSHGTRRAYYRHIADGESPCDTCVATQDDWRPVPPCGERRAYKRHVRRGERPDLACYDAEAAYQRDRRMVRAQTRRAIAA